MRLPLARRFRRPNAALAPRGVLRAAAWLGALCAMACASAVWADPSRRVALVVGAANYVSVAPLKNTAADATGVAQALTRLGFEVRVEHDPGRAKLEAALRRFGLEARGADASLFFYAGHAIEIQGKNWLIPIDAKLETARDVRLEAVDVDAVMEQAQAARVALLFLDACRNNPFADKLAVGARSGPARGLARIDPAAGVFVAFATAPGQVAYDGQGENSPFTSALLRHLEEPGLEVRQLMSRVRADVRRSTRDQAPWEQSALEGEFFFKPPADKPAPPAPAPAGFDRDALFWDSVRNSSRREDLEAYLERFPDGAFAVLAKGRIAALAPPSPSAPALSPAAPLASTPALSTSVPAAPVSVPAPTVAAPASGAPASGASASGAPASGASAPTPSADLPAISASAREPSASSGGGTFEAPAPSSAEPMIVSPRAPRARVKILRRPVVDRTPRVHRPVSRGPTIHPPRDRPASPKPAGRSRCFSAGGMTYCS
jgi:hypothetical protein